MTWPTVLNELDYFPALCPQDQSNSLWQVGEYKPDEMVDNTRMSYLLCLKKLTKMMSKGLFLRKFVFDVVYVFCFLYVDTEFADMASMVLPVRCVFAYDRIYRPEVTLCG